MSFIPNDSAEKYQIKVSGIDSEKDLLFSLNAEYIEAEENSPSSSNIKYKKGDKLYIGSLEYEKYIIDYPGYVPKVNKEALWYNTMEFDAVSKNDSNVDEKNFTVSSNGTDRTFSITPYAQTIWNNGESNKHLYLYIKWEDDESFRWKYRILVGGVFESLDLYKYSESSETAFGEDGYVAKAGESINWTLRVKYNPTIGLINLCKKTLKQNLLKETYGKQTIWLKRIS